MCDSCCSWLDTMSHYTGLSSPRPSLITSNDDHPKKTKSQISVHVSKKKCDVSNHKGMVSKLMTSKEQILTNYSDVCAGIGCFPGPPTISKLTPVSQLIKPLVNLSSQRVFQDGG